MLNDMYEYDFTDCKGVLFEQSPILNDFFTICFKNKAAAKAAGNYALEMCWKIIANSGYGFWGLRSRDRDSIVITEKGNIDIYKYLNENRLINIREIGDYVSMRVVKDLEMKDFNVGIASAISSYSRMKLWNAMHDFESKGGKVYYCDTDSIITDFDMSKDPEMMEKYCWDGKGDALGSLKNEALDKMKKFNKKASADKQIDIQVQMSIDGGDASFDKAVFAGCKFYTISKKCYNGQVIEMCKLKGFKDKNKQLGSNEVDDSLEYNDFADLMHDGSKIITQNQTQFNIPKSSMVDEQRNFGLKTIGVTKKFSINYKKGNVNKQTGEVQPFRV